MAITPTPPAASAADHAAIERPDGISAELILAEYKDHGWRCRWSRAEIWLAAQLARDYVPSAYPGADAEECEFCGGSGKAPPQETASAVEGDYGCQSCGRPMGYKTMGTAAICQICCEEERVGAGTEGLAVRKPELTTQPLVNETRLSPNDVGQGLRREIAAWCEAQSKLPQNQYHHNVVADWLREQAAALRSAS